MATATAALELISSANLRPTEHQLLKHFIEGAVDSDLAAQYLLSRINQSAQHDIETCLRNFKQDWRDLVTRATTFDPIPKRLDSLVRLRDGPNCFMTKGQQGDSVVASESAYILPPSMFRNLESVREGRLFSVLEAFLSPFHISRLWALLLNQTDDDQASLQNLWLLSPSIHKAFRAGHVEVRLKSELKSELLHRKIPESEVDETTETFEYVLRRLYPEEASGLDFGNRTKFEGSLWFFNISTSDAKALSLPSPFLFRVHHRFATALHLFSIEDKIARGWPRPQKDFLGPRARQVFYRMWLYVPIWARMRCYSLLVRIGRWLYGPSTASWVQRVPFGLVVKDCVRGYKNEPNALRLVEKYTSIPAPRVIDVGEYKDAKYLVMTRLPGQTLEDVFHLMTYAERDRFADDLGAYAAQLRRIPNTTPYLFCDTLGGPIIDHRMPDGGGGPFNNESDFNNHLTSHLKCTSAEFFPDQALRLDHRSYFTHSDFHWTNLLVENGRLSGIVDWECAGYLPEYWEFTKAIWTTLGSAEMGGLYRRALGNYYEPELEVERKLWRYTPFGV